MRLKTVVKYRGNRVHLKKRLVYVAFVLFAAFDPLLVVCQVPNDGIKV